ncbi:AprI/Inh family metalloprotease inhibitor [Pseudomonas gessardii]|uniref:AprI/Inh family metalloprotease inhibitor n=3 Tax=Pseudomonas gessardii TaxID=78544 RepID=A0ABS9F992_9PSED|nr:AprI/Inh family metalloprotease inhibitor [Pseudomonas gessardii]MCF5086502.1 AprI/Inh family metalloprotease inhibitor [Pseudomonas gessardii]MCF5097356.1 AprI/Inh family metalloprotease inhibitor [Pseudomonas gessardii]MCF5108909.1 AprI/Inh family metalloprotease inhibitor [Pseudomonas gessardii]
MVMTIFRNAIAWLIPALLVSAGANAMASSLVLPSTAQLAGHWQLRQQGQVCKLDLIAQPNAVAGDIGCAQQWLEQTPVTWLPTPDGIWLMNAEGTGITHLNRQKDGEYTATSKSGLTLVLQRTQ